MNTLLLELEEEIRSYHEAVSSIAIRIQTEISKNNFSYEELADIHNTFTRAVELKELKEELKEEGIWG